MGKAAKTEAKPEAKPEEPKLARRHLNKHSHLKSGRTIGERREHLETASERLEAKKKTKKRQTIRVVITVIIFVIGIGAGLYFLIDFLKQQAVSEVEIINNTPIVKTYTPTIEIIDENVGAGQITSRMSEYIGKLESDLRDLGLEPIKAVIPSGSIREVDIYFNGRPGYVKTTIDRGTGVTAEDTERMFRYLAAQGVNEYTYIDVRIDGKAYWK
ncbi:hypothetical protein J6S55_02995 [Candidatus Saccharibacteria bacterium]|nr:hypothetical protein [Candidatus Saccharibacteria bacterium]